jgi:hypothetical protein
MRRKRRRHAETAEKIVGNRKKERMRRKTRMQRLLKIRINNITHEARAWHYTKQNTSVGATVHYQSIIHL